MNYGGIISGAEPGFGGLIRSGEGFTKSRDPGFLLRLHEERERKREERVKRMMEQSGINGGIVVNVVPTPIGRPTLLTVISKP